MIDPGLRGSVVWTSWSTMPPTARCLTISTQRSEPEDIANPVAFLCSRPAGWITGQAIKVDGGHTIGGL